MISFDKIHQLKSFIKFEIQLIIVNNMLKHLNTELEPTGKEQSNATTFMMSFVETAEVSEPNLVAVLTNYEKGKFDSNCSYSWQYAKKDSEFLIDIVIHYDDSALEKEEDMIDIIESFEKHFMSYYNSKIMY